MPPPPGTRSRVALAWIWLAVGLAMVAAPVWWGLTRWSPLLNGHPATLATVAACLLLGLFAVSWSVGTLVGGARWDAMGDPEHPRYRTPRQRTRRAKLRIGLAVPALVLAVVLTAWLGYARPFAATAEAEAALRSDGSVSVAERPTWYELTPAKRDGSGTVIQPTTGLVFVPGARVDSRAYAPLLRPVAAAGYLGIVLKEPFGFAVPTSNRPADLIDLHPEIRFWAVGGHSLGGVNAAAVAEQDRRISGLLLWASYPASPITRGSLAVTSISGSRDGLATPADIEASRSKLPAATTFQVVDGGVHAYFGDYGDQPGDGEPAIDRSTAQTQIETGTIKLLAAITPRRTR